MYLRWANFGFSIENYALYLGFCFAVILSMPQIRNDSKPNRIFQYLFRSSSSCFYLRVWIFPRKIDKLLHILLCGIIWYTNSQIQCAFGSNVNVVWCRLPAKISVFRTISDLFLIRIEFSEYKMPKSIFRSTFGFGNRILL